MVWPAADENAKDLKKLKKQKGLLRKAVLVVLYGEGHAGARKRNGRRSKQGPGARVNPMDANELPKEKGEKENENTKTAKVPGSDNASSTTKRQAISTDYSIQTPQIRESEDRPMLYWDKLLTPRRFRDTASVPRTASDNRSPYKKDFDTVCNSTVLRRLQDKA